MRIIIISFILYRGKPTIVEEDSNKRLRPGGNQRSKPITWESERLLAGQNYALILHEGNEYRLQKTRSGKLILTK
jgi:hemin uptake protein HemP